MALQGCHELRQERHQPLGADIIGRRPGHREGLHDGGAILPHPGAHDGAGRGDAGLPQEPDGIFTGIAGRGDELIEDGALLPWRRRAVPRRRLHQQLPLGLKTHAGPHSSAPFAVPSARLLRVTLFVRQQLSLSYISREAMRPILEQLCERPIKDSRGSRCSALWPRGHWTWSGQHAQAGLVERDQQAPLRGRGRVLPRRRGAAHCGQTKALAHRCRRGRSGPGRTCPRRSRKQGKATSRGRSVPQR